MTTRKEKRWRRWASDKATAIVRQDEQRCLNLALERFRRHLRQLERQYGSLTDVPCQSLVSTGKGQRTIRSKARKANIVWTPTDNGPKLNRLAGGGKISREQESLGLNPIILDDRIVMLRGVSRDKGNKWKLGNLGFRYRTIEWKTIKVSNEGGLWGDPMQTVPKRVLGEGLEGEKQRKSFSGWVIGLDEFKPEIFNF